MHDVEQLRVNMLHKDYEIAQEIREACRAHAYNLSAGFAISYRAGLVDGKQASKDALKRAYKALQEARDRIAYLEAEKSNMVTIADLINHPEPDSPEPELEAPEDDKSLADRIAENDK